ncbi:LOW QUALITY PROTEIN: hypothetical protein Nmel_017767, partial [Mimus melanotis]
PPGCAAIPQARCRGCACAGSCWTQQFCVHAREGSKHAPSSVAPALGAAQSSPCSPAGCTGAEICALTPPLLTAPARFGTLPVEIEIVFDTAARGHTNAGATVQCQVAETQIITGSHDTSTKLWDLVAGKTHVTLTNHKKSVRAAVLHPRHHTFASGSPDNIKQWKFPDGKFIQNLSGHNAAMNTLAVSSNGVLVSGADNGTVHLWDWRTGHKKFQGVPAAVQPGSLDIESGIFACAVDQSESRLLMAGAGKTINIYKEDDPVTEETCPVSWKPEIIRR